ncbi:MAG: hypothetical protein ACXVZ2_02560 [Gaiellaceae bacterium]
MRLSKHWIAAGVAAIVVIAAGVAYAAIPDSNGVIHACMLKSTGTIRLIDPSLSSKDLRGHCTTLETEVSWSQQGPKGDPGLQGAPGAKGDPGTLSSLEALNGIPCKRLGLKGLTGVFLAGPAAIYFNTEIACVTADSSEPNETQAMEQLVSGSATERTLYPAGDEDWYQVSSAYPGGMVPNSVSVGQVQTLTDTAFNAPIHIEIYGDGNLLASGDGQASFSGGHALEVHVSGPGPALYRISAFNS